MEKYLENTESCSSIISSNNDKFHDFFYFFLRKVSKIILKNLFKNQSKIFGLECCQTKCWIYAASEAARKQSRN